jgi:hypothetical protein
VVVRAAAQALNENGIDKASLDDVGERLNVTKPKPTFCRRGAGWAKSSTSMPKYLTVLSIFV